MQCRHCRAEMPDNYKFCTYCGTALSEEALEIKRRREEEERLKKREEARLVLERQQLLEEERRRQEAIRQEEVRQQEERRRQEEDKQYLERQKSLEEERRMQEEIRQAQLREKELMAQEELLNAQKLEEKKMRIARDIDSIFLNNTGANNLSSGVSASAPHINASAKKGEIQEAGLHNKRNYIEPMKAGNTENPKIRIELPPRPDKRKK